MAISADALVGYEEVFKPVKVSPIPGTAQTWRIQTPIDVGPSGVFSKSSPITFALRNGILTTDHKPQQSDFRKCR